MTWIKSGQSDRFCLTLSIHAYRVSAGSDRAVTIRVLRREFPHKLITAVVPPGRKRSDLLHGRANGGTIHLNVGHLEGAVMPAVVFKPGMASTWRPNEYAPPAG